MTSNSPDRTVPAPAEQEPGPRRRSLPRRLLRWLEHGLAGAMLLLVAFFFSPLPGRLFASLDRQDELRPAKYIVCLGGDANRVIEAARLLTEGYGEKLIVSNNPGAAPMMRGLAVEWGAPPDRVLVDDQAWRTADHPHSIQRTCGVDPARDSCIIVTSYNHLARSKACFERAGYRHILMREVRWERQFRRGSSWKGNYRLVPELIYEYAAFVEYWVRGYV